MENAGVVGWGWRGGGGGGGGGGGAVFGFGCCGCSEAYWTGWQEITDAQLQYTVKITRTTRQHIVVHDRSSALQQGRLWGVMAAFVKLGHIRRMWGDDESLYRDQTLDTVWYRFHRFSLCSSTAKIWFIFCAEILLISHNILTIHGRLSTVGISCGLRRSTTLPTILRSNRNVSDWRSSLFPWISC